MEKNAGSLVEHWSWAAEKGLMNRNTAAGFRSACARVLEVLGDDWEQSDISRLDVEELLLRFQNLKKKDFRPQVLETYKQRFRKALTSYLEYLENPGGWKPVNQERSAASQRNDRTAKRQPATNQVATPPPSMRTGTDEVEYPFPLRSGVMARLVLPRDLTREDVNRLTAFMSMLVVGADSLRQVREASDERRDS
jgi:hypothetical protein